MSKEDRGRPPSGFEFCIENRFERYRLHAFEMRPTKVAAKIYELHFESGLTVAQLCELFRADPHLSKPTNMKRLIRNLKEWYARERDHRTRVRELGLD